ncbi:ABC transporter substrate-binding protein, partial [Paenibacillus sp. VTT E-133280]
AQEEVLNRLGASAMPNKKMILSLLDHARPMPTYPFMIQVWEALNTGLTELPLSNPEQALKKIEQAIQASWGVYKS